MRNQKLWAVPRWAGLALMAGVLAVLVFATPSDEDNQRAFIQQAVERAVVQCYALEGAYPPDIDYVRQHYGLHVDEERYFIHYRVIGANLRPEIMVIEKQR